MALPQNVRNKIATRLGLGLNRAQRDSNKIRLEAYTERSESNPGRSLGIYRTYSDCCLEDSTSQRAKYPRQSDKSVFVSPLSFFRTRIYRIDTDTSLVGRYCLPDSSHYMLYKSRDFVPGYSRFARYWLPARSTIYATKQPKTDNP